jgi:hypothetical protein
MLNKTRVLNYIKDNLAFPFTQLELTDEKIIEYFTEHTLREFSYYVPEVKTVPIDLNLETNRVPNKQNEYYIHEPQGLEILNVVDCYFDQSDWYALGHPPFGVFNHFELREWALRVEQAGQTKMFSSFDYTHEFKHPNIVRVSPAFPTQLRFFTVEYERQQNPDLSGIPNDLHLDFQKLALADIQILMGRIRKKYGGGNLRTPFGEIPLESEIFEEGRDLKREQIEKLERLFIPNVKVDHG